MADIIVQVTPPPAVLIQVATTGPQGAQGPIGPAGSSGLKVSQSTPSATWVIPHALGREPGVQVYLATGEQVDADIVATSNTVTVVFPAATSGFVILN